MEKKILDDLFSILFDNSKFLAENVSGILFEVEMLEEYDEKFGNDGYSKAILFESLALLYTEFSIYLINNRADFWQNSNLQLVSKISHFLDKLFIDSPTEFDWDSLFFSRVNLYNSEGEFHKIKLNIKKFDIAKLDENDYLVMGEPNDKLADNSLSFYYWKKEPLSFEKSKKFDFEEQDLLAYKVFLGGFLGASIKMIKDLESMILSMH